MLLVGFFVLNMFVGVIVENFHKCRENQEQEEITRRAAQNVRSVDRKQRSKSTQPVCVWGGGEGCLGIYIQTVSNPGC